MGVKGLTSRLTTKCLSSGNTVPSVVSRWREASSYIVLLRSSFLSCNSTWDREYIGANGAELAFDERGNWRFGYGFGLFSPATGVSNGLTPVKYIENESNVVNIVIIRADIVSHLSPWIKILNSAPDEEDGHKHGDGFERATRSGTSSGEDGRGA